MYYKVSIIETGCSYAPKGEYQRFNRITKSFATLDEARQFITDKYGKCKRVKMYQDDKNGKAKPVGWIYCFNNENSCHTPVEKWRQQDWVQLLEVEETPRSW